MGLTYSREVLAEQKRGFADRWCAVYPTLVKTGFLDNETMRLCFTFFCAVICPQISDKAEGEKEAIEAWQKANPDAPKEGFIIPFLPVVAREIHILQETLSKNEKITKNPTWYGDLVDNLVGMKDFRNKEETVARIRLRAALFNLMDLQNVQCIKEGHPQLLLEQECTDWALNLLIRHCNKELSQVQITEADINIPLQKQFHFQPQDFVPSTLRKVHARYNIRQEKVEYSHPLAGPHSEWFCPLLALPSLFAYSDGTQNFDKRLLLSTIRELLVCDNFPETDNLDLIKDCAATLGLYITWSPSIHTFCSLTDQRKIQLFYLALTLDSKCDLYGLPTELFLKIFEDGFYLGQKHKKCTCQVLPYICDCPCDCGHRKGMALCVGSDINNDYWATQLYQ